MRQLIIMVAAAIIHCWAVHHAAAQVKDQVKEDFELVEKIGSRRAYEIFLGTHPTGPYSDIVRERLKKFRSLNDPLDEEFNRRLIERQKQRQ